MALEWTDSVILIGTFFTSLGERGKLGQIKCVVKIYLKMYFEVCF